MAVYVVHGDKLTAIADAIRKKKGSSGTLTIDQIPTEIESIETATKVSLQDKTITVNGTYTADAGFDGLGQVTVNVPSSADALWNSILSRSFTEINLDVTNVGEHSFGGCRSLVTASLPNAKTINDYAFYNCTKLTGANIPNATIIGSYAFSGCTSLKSISLPNVTTVRGSAFNGCTSLEELHLPKLNNGVTQAFGSIRNIKRIVLPSLLTANSYLFSYCYALETVDLPTATSIKENVFNGCYKLVALILRSETMCTLSNANAFTNCYHMHGTTNANYNPTGAKDCYVYVPRALVDSYKVATNWKNYATQFRALEDYTVDGTITGALDESKI